MRLSLTVIAKICDNIYKKGTSEIYGELEIAEFLESLDLVSNGSVLVEKDNEKDTSESAG